MSPAGAAPVRIRRLFGALGREVLRGTAAVTGIGIAVKATAVGKEMVVAHAFGASGALDAYLVALAVPSFALTIFATSFATALVPEIVARQRADPDGGVAFIRHVIGISLCGVVLLTLGLALLGPAILGIIGFGFDPAHLALARGIYFTLLPVFFFGTLTTVFGAIANARRRFAVPAATPAIIVAAMLLLLVLRAADWGVYALAAGTSLGFALETVALALFLRRADLPWRPAWQPSLQSRPWQVLRGTGPLVGGAIFMGGATVLDQAMVTSLEPGDVALLSYGSRLTAVVVTLIGALATVSLPYFSTLVAERDWRGVRRTLVQLAAWIAIATVPVALAIGAASEALMRIMFERGAFTRMDTAAAAWVQTLCAVQIPFYVLTLVAMRAITAMGRNHAVAALSFLFLSVNAAGNFLLMHRMGVGGIALATSIAYLATSAASLAYALGLARRLAREEGRRAGAS
jgi:putative peptidoglycan lipid II flippase